MDQRMEMPYVKPSLETIDVRTLTEAVGPVQALSSGSTETPNLGGNQQLTGGSSSILKARKRR